jgi:ribosomal subunit interface protein
VDIIFKGRRTGLPDRFRKQATAKLAKIGKLDQKAIRIDVEVSQERNPRQADRRERVELTIRSRGPVIRAEAAAEDRFVALDRAIAKLEARLRRASDRRKDRHGGWPAVTNNLADQFDEHLGDGSPVIPDAGALLAEDVLQEGSALAVSLNGDGPAQGDASLDGAWRAADARSGDFVPIAMEGDGPLVVREKFHAAAPMTIDQALLEMELVGHDFFLFHDEDCDRPSVVYRRHGYDYGVIRLVEEATAGAGPAGPGGAAYQGDRHVGQNRAAG